MPDDTPIFDAMQAKYKRDILELRAKKERERQLAVSQEASTPEAIPEVKAEPPKPEKPKTVAVRGFRGGDPVAVGKLGGRPKGRKNNPKPNPLEALSPKKQAYALEKCQNGGNAYQAAKKVGYSESMALKACVKIETPDFRAAFAEYLRQTIPTEKIGKRLSEALDAVETKYFAKDGLVIDSRTDPNWSERRKAAKDIAQMSDRFIPKADVQVSQVIDESTARRLADLGEKLLSGLSQQELRQLNRSHVPWCDICQAPHIVGEHVAPIVDAEASPNQ